MFVSEFSLCKNRLMRFFPSYICRIVAACQNKKELLFSIVVVQRRVVQIYVKLRYHYRGVSSH